PGTAALVVTAAQFGYATGIYLLVPLGDRATRPRGASSRRGPDNAPRVARPARRSGTPAAGR
ncbi:hypothetical protein ACM614_19855, partial [Streptomyces sp. 12297]